MSTKQSKIFNFFQRKSNVSNNTSTISRDNSFNGGEQLKNASSPNASGDVNHGTKVESMSTSKCGDISMKTKRCLDDMEDTFEDDFPEPSLLDNIFDNGQKYVEKDPKTEMQESRPPKKRKRIVCFF